MKELFQKIMDSKFIIINFSFIPKYLSKYDSIWEDLKSLMQYYLFGNRNKKYKIKIETLGIFPTTICNANCVFCANRYLQDKRQILDFKLFKKIVNQFKRQGGNRVGLTPIAGDSLIDPDFLNKVAYLNKKKIHSSLYTNAILLNKYADKIISSGLNEIYIDLADIDSFYDSKVFQISQKVSKTRIKGILNFLKKIKEENANILVEISFRPMRKPKEILRDLKKSKIWEHYLNKNVNISFLQAYDNWGGAITKKDLLGNQTLKRPCKIKKYPCKNLFTLAMHPNGDLRLCGCRYLKTLNDELMIGNIKSDSLDDLKKSVKWGKIIENFQNEKLPKVCEKCSFYRPKFNPN